MSNPATATSINVADNTLASNTQAGIMLLGTVGATIGSSTASLGNTITGGQMGLYVGGPGSDFASSTNNDIFNNKVDGPGATRLLRPSRTRGVSMGPDPRSPHRPPGHRPRIAAGHPMAPASVWRSD